MGEVLTSRTNPRVKQLRAAFANQPRLASGLIAIEGRHLLEEALTTNQAIKTIFLSERTAMPDNLPREIEILRLAPDVFQSCTDTQTPQGIAALLVPPTGAVERMFLGVPLILIAVGLQDPGNLGTLIRSALAFGATGVLATAGTVSAWNGKTIRASAGAVFRIPLAAADDEMMAMLQQNSVAILASVKDRGTPVSAVDLSRPCALLIGNEGAGLTPEWLARAGERVTIPTPGAVESLNAAIAGSLLLYEAARQRGASAFSPNGASR
jgi:TrmH family RNA methyltransferase